MPSIAAKILASLGISGAQLLIYALIAGGAVAWFWNEKRVAYNSGYSAAVAECNERIRKETERIATAQNEAMAKAMDMIKDLLTKKDEQDAELAKLREEAALDPDAGKCGLNADSVRRTNQIR